MLALSAAVHFLRVSEACDDTGQKVDPGPCQSTVPVWVYHAFLSCRRQSKCTSSFQAYFQIKIEVAINIAYLFRLQAIEVYNFTGHQLFSGRTVLSLYICLSAS